MDVVDSIYSVAAGVYVRYKELGNTLKSTRIVSSFDIDKNLHHMQSCTCCSSSED
jgi:hypothetical protein